MREKVVERFLKYVTFDTTANPNNSNCPSSEGQRVFANYLVEELKSLGLDDARTKYSGRPIQRELTLEEQLQRTQAELEILKIENELLKKLRLMRKLLE